MKQKGGYGKSTISGARHAMSRGGPRVLSLAMGLCVGGASWAESGAPAPEALPELRVEGDWLGDGSGEAVRRYTGARTVVDEETLRESGARNLEDALRTVPNITILDETGTGILPNIGVRGLSPFRSERVQVLQDGYPIAIGPYSNIGLSLFPITMQSIESIDVVRGGAAVHYGPNNVGGVLNFKTREIPTEPSQQVRQALTVAESTGHVLSDTYYRVGGFARDDLALQFQANVLRGDGERAHAGTEVNSFIADVDYFPSASHEWRAQVQYYQVDADLPGALSPSAYEADRTQSQRPYDAFDADMVRGTLTWLCTPNDDTEFAWRNFAHKADRTFFFGQDLSGGGHWADPASTSTHVADSPRRFTVLGTEPRLTRRIGNHTLTLGARYVNEDVDFDVNRRELATGTYSAVRDWHFDTDAFAVYASDTIRTLNGRLTITPGLRYEHVDMSYYNSLNGDNDTNRASELLPGLSVGYRATDNMFMFANAQRSLVPVQTAQVTREGDVANETAWNYEVGARYRFNANNEATVTLFRIDYQDQIQFNRSTSRFENLGETRHQGVELEWAGKPHRDVELRAAYTYLDTEQLTGDNTGNETPNAPPHRLSVSADVERGPWDFNIAAQYVAESYSDAANTEQETSNGSAGKLPSYTLVNARIGRDVKLGGGADLNLSLAINNVLDEEYYFRGVDVSPVGRLPAPGRAFTLAAEVTW